jgi:hypothetical protein
MTASAIQSPLPQFFDNDGKPLDSGRLYFGVVSGNPETSPITVYWDAAQTQPAAQPVRTINGYTARSGTPAPVYSSVDYSLTVKDKRGRQVLYSQNSASLAVALASPSAGNGPALVGYQRPESGAIAETVETALDKQLPSIMQIIPVALHAAIYAKSSTTDVSSYFQDMINLGAPFTVPSGAKFRLNSALNWVSGAKMFSYGDDYIVSTQHAYMTALEFDSSLCTSGIIFAPTTSQLIQDWGFDGIVFDTTSTGAAYTSFKMLDIQSTAGGGAFHFKFGKNTIQHCYQAINADDGFFSGDLGDLSISFCIRGITKTTNNFATSLKGTLKFFHVFSPLDLSNATYCNFDAFFDFCGLQAVISGTPPATEMPCLLKTNAARGINFGYFGVENSKAIRIRLENYSSVEANIYEYQPVGLLWESSATRITNVIQAEQALFSVKSSVLHGKNYVVFYSTGNGYPTVGAWGTGTNYFCWVGGDAASRLTFSNSFVDMTPYSVCSSGVESFLSAPRINNGVFTFGNAGVWRQDLNFVNGYLVVGSNTYTNDFHFIQRNKALVEGAEGFRVTPATSSNSIRFFASSGASPNAANAPFKVAQDSVTLRGINAGGTVNASGADYAEYERNNGLHISKGKIVGFKSDGTLTLTYSEAIRFGVKSTSPSYVGGDTWCTAVEPEDGASPEAWDEFRAQMEIDRAKVDRIAYSGKVPCNVGGATPGQYIVASLGPDDTIIGLPVTNPDLAQFLKAVGRVNRILEDGRAEVAVITH